MVSMVQCGAVCCSVLHHFNRDEVPFVSVRFSVEQGAVVCWSVLECVGVCCSVLQHFERDETLFISVWSIVVQCVTVCHSVLQRFRA